MTKQPEMLNLAIPAVESHPFDHVVIDNFLPVELANQLSSEFLDYNDPRWLFYQTPVEHKKTIDNWRFFPSTTYQFFCYLNSDKFINWMKTVFKVDNLYPDPGLHGAGWHIHECGGKLHIHKDYNVHPLLDLQRKYNIIVYLSPDWEMSWGGGLELWSGEQKPTTYHKTVDCRFNRAVIFDTTQNSWHGFNDPLTCGPGVYRKSIAMYYLTDKPQDTDPRSKALFTPNKEQEGDLSIENFIRKRAGL